LLQVKGGTVFFFAQQGLQVIAIDRNSVASDLISGFSRDLGRLSVVKMDVVEDSLSILNHTRLSCAWYARFFLHTLTDNQLSRFFKNLSSAMNPKDYFFAEYRNEKDKWLVKAMPSHFRNFFTSESIAAEAEQNNLKCIYEIEGRGFAKWGIDDAVVSRQIFVRDGASNGG
jgi:hypothetical protein